MIDQVPTEPVRTCARRACNKRLKIGPRETAPRFKRRKYCSDDCRKSVWKTNPTKKGIG